LPNITVHLPQTEFQGKFINIGLFVEYDPDLYIFKYFRALDAGDVRVFPGDPKRGENLSASGSC
jgi:hypothetical protein